MKINTKLLFIFLALLTLVASCDKDDELNYKKREIAESTDEIDLFMKDHFLDKYNCAIRWKWDDKFVSIDYYVSPPIRSVVVKTAEMVENFWVNPFIECSTGGKAFIEKNFPPEIVFIGSEILNQNGTETLGFAEAGVRITLTELNQYDLKNEKWLKTQLHTIHHEFSHIVHQTYNLPNGFEKISGSFYTGNSWTTLARYKMGPDGKPLRDKDGTPIFDHSLAIKRGVTTAYGTTNEYEDFAELVSNFIITDAKEFNDVYLPVSETEIQEAVVKVHNEIMAATTIEVLKIKNTAFYAALKAGKSVAEARAAGDKAVSDYAIIKSVEKSEELKSLNSGKHLIKEKLEMIKAYYQKNFDVDLVSLRNIVQRRIVNAQKGKA